MTTMTNNHQNQEIWW